MDGGRSGAQPEAEASRRRSVLRASRLPRRRAPGGGADGSDSQGARGPGAIAARRRVAQACRQGLRLRARATLRPRSANYLAPSQGAPSGGDRGFGARGTVGLLLRPPRGARRALRLASSVREMSNSDRAEQVREAVRERYAAAAEGATCCGPEGSATPALLSDDEQAVFGASQYADDERQALPQEAQLASLGCGNPTAVAELHEGETVLDLGSGGGIDVLLSAQRVGPSGRAYGLDMTDEMLALARQNAARARARNVRFLKGEIEAIPLPEASVDVVISNCVINLSGDKPSVLREAAPVP